MRNTYVGNKSTRGLSGGEKKRLNVGIEMISSPEILFLDEPTTGLDSFQALQVVLALKNLVNYGYTVVASIHQPRSQIMSLFDELILLSEGHMIYNGPNSEAKAFFEKSGLSCPSNYNIADFYMDNISMDYRSEEQTEASKQQVEKLQAAWL